MTDTPLLPPDPAAPPPREAAGRFRLRALVAVAVISAAAAGSLGFLIARNAAGPHVEVKRTMYQCPMHPTIVQDHPGECPICGMKLVPMGEGDSAPPAASGQRKVKFYRSPMNPAQTSPVPRKDEMGMDYVPVYEDEAEGAASSVQGMAAVTIDPSRQQLIGLKSVEVTRSKVGGAWRTVGRVAFDETRVRQVNVKVPVYVERVYVDFLGRSVEKGAPLFSGYSPELLAAQDEYRIAIRTQRSLASSPGGADQSELVAASRRKLELWDLPKSAIERLERTGESQRTVTFYSPISGVVTKKDVVEGTKLDAGAMPYEVVDISKVWVMATVYESDIHRIRLGMHAKLTLKAVPNQLFEGTVIFLDPVLSASTRTLRVRLEFPNPTGELRPEMFGEVLLEAPMHDGLRIPEDAVINSGAMTVVFVALGQGKFVPREVKLGDSDGTNVEVVSGLSDGEKVVVHANFLVDSESRLRASLAALSNAASPKPPASTEPVPSAAPAPVPVHSTHGAAPATPKGEHAGHSMSDHAASASAAAASSRPAQDAAPTYGCPMHPEVQDSKPSRCPKCGMSLTPIETK
ncbi:MAG: efflux RND transporter periplasmic adaptor subunit [Deltaproteobacteria bacterium]|nr:efflux RND transporter periplasmic adaptor subunit [Deltaproteobacteria bacterium]